MLGIAFAYILVTIPIGGGDVLIQGGVYPSYQLRYNLDIGLSYDVGGFATPFGTVHNGNRTVEVEEYLHLRQWLALGPWLAPAYAITGGEPFEPYSWRGDIYTKDFSVMWIADEIRYHQWTVTVGESWSVEFMRGWF